MGRWTAPSDFDYYDDVEGGFLSGLEVPCRDCGRPMLLTKDDRGLLHVSCDDCVRTRTEYHAAQTDARRI